MITQSCVQTQNIKPILGLDNFNPYKVKKEEKTSIWQIRTILIKTYLLVLTFLKLALVFVAH